MYDWRKWAFEQLLHPPFADVVPEAALYAGASVKGVPDRKPFVVLVFGLVTPELNDGDAPAAQSWTLTVWAYDAPGSYEQIDSLLAMARQQLVGQVAGSGAHGCVWQGDSGDLADDTYDAITKNSSFRLVGGA